MTGPYGDQPGYPVGDWTPPPGYSAPTPPPSHSQPVPPVPGYPQEYQPAQPQGFQQGYGPGHPHAPAPAIYPAAQPGYYAAAQPVYMRRTNGLAVASMVLGIVWLWWVGSILALVFGYVARQQIRERDQGGDGMAIAGIVLGWVAIGVFVIVLLTGLSFFSRF